MYRQRVSLILNAVILLGWSVVGINRAIVEPSWLCILDGCIMMAYLLMTIDDIYALVRARKIKKKTVTVQEQESTTKASDSKK